jgi:hypothetical protein
MGTAAAAVRAAPFSLAYYCAASFSLLFLLTIKELLGTCFWRSFNGVMPQVAWSQRA